MIQPPSPSPTPRILVVDDDPVVGRSILRLLRDQEVVFETVPEVALERVRRGERFALILSDVMMPGMTGPLLFDRIVAVAPEQRAVFVFMSGGVSDLLREMLAATGRPCLAKPITREVVIEHLPKARGPRHA